MKGWRLLAVETLILIDWSIDPRESGISTFRGAEMDNSAENIDNDDIVIIVENEAESLPAEEERLKQQGTFGLMDTCPVCKLSFQNREPKLLPCLHSFCKKCLPAPFRTADPRRDSPAIVDNGKPRKKQTGIHENIYFVLGFIKKYFWLYCGWIPSDTLRMLAVSLSLCVIIYMGLWIHLHSYCLFVAYKTDVENDAWHHKKIFLFSQ